MLQPCLGLLPWQPIISSWQYVTLAVAWLQVVWAATVTIMVCGQLLPLGFIVLALLAGALWSVWFNSSCVRGYTLFQRKNVLWLVLLGYIPHRGDWVMLQVLTEDGQSKVTCVSPLRHKILTGVIEQFTGMLYGNVSALAITYTAWCVTKVLKITFIWYRVVNNFCQIFCTLHLLLIKKDSTLIS